MILIDALYLDSLGGKTLIELLIKKTIDTKLKCYFLLDSRLDSKLFMALESKNYLIINSSLRNRKLFYKDNISKFSSILCLSNIPPPVKTKKRTSIYFHNKLLINPFSHKINFKDRFLNFLKFVYIRHFNYDNYNWIVQTPLMKKMIQDTLKIDSNNCFIYPFFELNFHKSSSIRNPNSFIYVSSSLSHKNHKKLLKAFCDAANKSKRELVLHLTIKKEEIPEKIYPKNLKIEFHGIKSNEGINKLYSSCEFAIYPSLAESFGLPLIEAANLNCKVITSNLDYVYEVIEPSLVFDPNSTKSISTSILKAINEDLPKSKVIVKNKLDNFIEYIVNQNVQ